VLFFVVLAMTVWFGKSKEVRDIPFTETVQPPGLHGWQPAMDRLSYWIALSFALIAVIYGPFLVSHLPPRLVAQPFQGF
jgi:cytochrome c oxidase subunit 1